MKPEPKNKFSGIGKIAVVAILTVFLLANALLIPWAVISLQDKPLFGQFHPVDMATMVAPQNQSLYYARTLHTHLDADISIFLDSNTTVEQQGAPAPEKMEDLEYLTGQIFSMGATGVIPYSVVDAVSFQLSSKEYTFSATEYDNGIRQVDGYFYDAGIDRYIHVCSFILDQKNQKIISCNIDFSFWGNMGEQYDLYALWEAYVQWLELGEVDDWQEQYYSQWEYAAYSEKLKLTLVASYQPGSRLTLFAYN